MQLVTALKPQKVYKHFQIFGDCTITNEKKSLSHWAIEQLQVNPFQHILEIGYNNGNTINEMAKKTKAGFLAGIDASINSFQQATKKNKNFIESRKIQLHLGHVADLPYPSQYFDSIYSTAQYEQWKEPKYLFMQLHMLLKNGGKLLTIFQPRQGTTENNNWNALEKISEEYKEAGFVQVGHAYLENPHGESISVIGYKD